MGRDRSDGLQHCLLLLGDALGQDPNLLLHGCHASRQHCDCFDGLGQLNIKGCHQRSWGWLVGGGEEDGGFGEGRRGLSVTRERRGGQKVVPRAKTIVAKVLDGIPSVMILIV